MRYWASLKGRLSLVFLLLFATIVSFGLVSVWSLSNSNEVSTDVRDRWLPNTRLLGDLNNFTSDYRTAEADTLLASTPAELSESLHDIQVLDQAVLRAQRSYEAIPHGVEEADLYRQFKATWTIYKSLASEVTALTSSGHATEAAALYRSKSRTTYDAASDLLGRLTDHNVAEAARASERSVRAYERARWLMAAALAMAALMLTIVVSQVTRTVSHPLLELGRAMHRLAANDTGIEIAHTGRTDEIGEMARAVVVFRSNAIELAQSQRGLAQQATMLEEKLTHEQYVTQLQRNFVSMITHEFRTPLTQIDAQAQRLISLKERLSVADVDQRASHIRAAVTRIIRLIDSLVETSRVMDGDANLFFHPEQIDLADVLRDVCRLHRELSPATQILEDYGPDPSNLFGDPRLLFQALSNLVSNAIKYSPDGATVIIRMRKTAGVISVLVEDHGIGVPERDKAEIFTRYYRGSNVSTYVGSGVGLSLVATVLHLHGGDIAVDSVEGKGSRFTATLPDGQPQAAVPCQPDAKPLTPTPQP
jgi:two-component system OmpR family sensor kinase